MNKHLAISLVLAITSMAIAFYAIRAKHVYDDAKASMETRLEMYVISHGLEAYKCEYLAYPPDIDYLRRVGLVKSFGQPTWGDRVWRYTTVENGTKMEFYVPKNGKIYPGIYYSNGRVVHDE